MSDVEVIIPANGITHIPDERTHGDAIIIAPQQTYQPSSIAMPILNLELAIQRRRMVLEYIDKIFAPGVDFIEIPGTSKDGEPPKRVLSKSGAENLCSFFGLRPEFTVMEEVKDWSGEQHGGEPFFYVRYKCRLLRNDEVMGDGEGSCNSRESKYRYRWVSQDIAVQHGFDPETLPKRGDFIVEPEFAIKKAETTGKYGKPAEYWAAFQTAIDTGTAVKVTRKKRDGGEMDAWQIGSYVYRIPNPEIADIINTLEKMAQKRALIAACLIATGISGHFTQDLDDLQPEPEARIGTPEDVDTTTQKPKPAASQKPAPAPQAKQQPQEKPKQQRAAAGSSLADRIGKLAEKCGIAVGEFKSKYCAPYWRGYFNTDTLPKDPASYEDSIKVLEAMSDSDRAAFLGEPKEFGRTVVQRAAAEILAAATPQPKQQAAKPVPFNTSSLIHRVAEVRGIKPPEVIEHLGVVGITPDTPEAETIAYLRLCAVSRSARLAITASQNRKISLADVVGLIEQKIGSDLESGDRHEIEVALAEVSSGN